MEPIIEEEKLYDESGQADNNDSGEKLRVTTKSGSISDSSKEVTHFVL